MKRLLSKRQFLFILIIALFPLFTGCNKKKSTSPKAPAIVTTALIKQQDVPIYIDTIGQVISTVTVNIRPQVAGKLLKVYVQQGSIVEKDDLLYEIDPRPYQAILDEAKGQLAHDQALLDYANQAVARYKKVVEDNYISVLNYEQYESNAAAAKGQVELDKAAIAAAQLNLDFCKVVAPVAGKISYYNVDIGNIVAVDDPAQLTVIRPFSPIDITFALPQQQFELIRNIQGDAGEWKFVATLPENSQLSFDGETYFIDNQLNQNTGTILLKGRLPNMQREFWPGEFVRVKVLQRMVPNALTVPPSSVLIGKNGPYIYTIDHEGKAAATNVTVLTRTEEYIAIHSDSIHEGNSVIIEGQINIAPGSLVKSASAQEASVKEASKSNA